MSDGLLAVEGIGSAFLRLVSLQRQLGLARFADVFRYVPDDADPSVRFIVAAIRNRDLSEWDDSIWAMQRAMTECLGRALHVVESRGAEESSGLTGE